MFAALCYVQVLQIAEVYFHTVVKPVLPAPRINKASFFLILCYFYVAGNGLRNSDLVGLIVKSLSLAARKLCELVSCIFR